MRWPGGAVEALDAAAAAARDGRTWVVDVEGDAGFGKTTFLRHARTRLADFAVVSAGGEETAATDPYRLLQELGAITEGPPRHVLQATHALAALVDRSEPVAVILDDLQWVDPESVTAMAAFVERSAADGVLLLAAHRPLSTRRAPWSRLLDGSTDQTTRVSLHGLDRDAVAELVAELAPGAPDTLAERLRRHTAGNPLHLRALLREHSAAELAALAERGELPAPAELAAAVDARVTALGQDPTRLLRTLAVLDDGWTDLPVAAAIGGVDDPDRAARALRGAHLLRLDRTGPVPRVRLVHAVIRAAAYETVPTDVRRRTHGAAAARLSEPGDRLRHRLAAAPGPDEALAADLDEHADGLHGRGRYREAARFRRLAASVTADPAAVERRSLDADVEALLARDLDTVSPVAPTTPHRRLVEALRLLVERRWVHAAAALDGDLGGLGPLDTYRALVLRGWTIVAAGRDPAAALPALTEAAAAPVQDPAFGTWFTFAYGQARRAVTGRHEDLWGLEDSRTVDRATLASTRAGLLRLSWRGSIRALSDRPDFAVDDLAVVVGRIAAGEHDYGHGVFHALLGLARWLVGDWRRASISLDLALADGPAAAHPGALAVAPLHAVVTGGDVAAVMRRGRDALIAAPMRANVYAADIAEIAALGFGGTPTQRRDWLGRRTEDLGDPRDQLDGALPYLWVLSHGLAAAWTGDAATTDSWADDLADLDGVAWRPTAVAWLRALARRARGEAVAADLHEAAAAGLVSVPSLGALLWVDAADAAAGEHHPAAEAADRRAREALGALGAGGLAARLLRDGPAPTPSPATPPGAGDPLAALSGREREVVALLLEGLSYAQIATELYVTRSTVAFHLSKAYAKTGTRSRHELVALVR